MQIYKNLSKEQEEKLEGKGMLKITDHHALTPIGIVNIKK